MKQPRVKIVTPCAKNWEKFEQKGQNRFCSSCNKDIIDFRKMSEAEIIAYLNHNDAGVCGIVNRATPTLSIARKKSFLINSFFAFSAFIFGSTNGISQGKMEPTAISINSNIDKPTLIVSELVDEEKITVYGVVMDDTGEALPGVNIAIKGTTKGTQTDLDGKYRIEVSKSATLIFSYVGFETQEIEIGERTNIDIAMYGAVELGEVVIISKWYTPRGLWQRLKRIF